MKTKSPMWDRAEVAGLSSEKVDYRRYAEAWPLYRNRRPRAFDAPPRPRFDALPSDGRQVRDAKRVFFHRAQHVRAVSRERVFIPVTDAWVYLRKTDYPIEVRTRLLAELIGRGEDVSEFIINELSRAENDHLWRNELIFAAEHADFRGDGRMRMAALLLKYANNLLGSAKPDTVSAIWSALRRYTSLVGREGIAALAEFLSPAHAVGTKQVVLQSIQRVFMAGPPTDPLHPSLSALTQRVSELTRKYIDCDWLTPGENTSLAVNALCADAALADKGFVLYCEKLASLKLHRVSHMSSRLLGELLASWLSSKPNRDSSPLSRLRDGLSLLQINK